MIGLYDNYIFKGEYTRKLVARNIDIEFIGIWRSSEELFLSEYKRLYPNAWIQVYKPTTHAKNDMRRIFAKSIYEYISKNPHLKSIKRDEAIDELLS